MPTSPRPRVASLLAVLLAVPWSGLSAAQSVSFESTSPAVLPSALLPGVTLRGAGQGSAGFFVPPSHAAGAPASAALVRLPDPLVLTVRSGDVPHPGCRGARCASVRAADFSCVPPGFLERSLVAGVFGLLGTAVFGAASARLVRESVRHPASYAFPAILAAGLGANFAPALVCR